MPRVSSNPSVPSQERLARPVKQVLHHGRITNRRMVIWQANYMAQASRIRDYTINFLKVLTLKTSKAFFSKPLFRWLRPTSIFNRLSSNFNCSSVMRFSSGIRKVFLMDENFANLWPIFFVKKILLKIDAIVVKSIFFKNPTFWHLLQEYSEEE